MRNNISVYTRVDDEIADRWIRTAKYKDTSIYQLLRYAMDLYCRAYGPEDVQQEYAKYGPKPIIMDEEDI